MKFGWKYPGVEFGEFGKFGLKGLSIHINRVNGECELNAHVRDLFLVFTGWCNEKLYSSFYYGVISL
jgi:hypothetical protein